MNLLAHAVLAGERPAMIVGGVLGDWIKGPLGAELPADLAEGVRLHRRIDLLTDAHPAAARSRERLQGPWRRWAGVLVDLAYDWCLAARWSDFGRGDLDAFAARVHGLIAAETRLPEPAAAVAKRMIPGGWLLAARTWEGVETTLRRVSGRLRRPVPLAEAVGELRRREAELAADFAELFPAIAAASLPTRGSGR